LDRAIVLHCGRAPRKAHQALANGDAQLDQGRVILIDDPVASADLLATPRKSGPIITPAAPGVTKVKRPLFKPRAAGTA
jgi:hypothetical protein